MWMSCDPLPIEEPVPSGHGEGSIQTLSAQWRRTRVETKDSAAQVSREQYTITPELFNLMELNLRKRCSDQEVQPQQLQG